MRISLVNKTKVYKVITEKEKKEKMFMGGKEFHDQLMQRFYPSGCHQIYENNFTNGLNCFFNYIFQ